MAVCSAGTYGCAPSLRTPPRRRGFSLIELMVGLLLGLLLVEGIAVLVSQTHRVNAIQASLARLQQNGRQGLQAIVDDVRHAGHMPCGSRMRPLVYADALATHIAGVPATASAPAGWAADTPYPLARDLFIHGNACAGARCTPAITIDQDLPREGLVAGDRVAGTDVLTVRSLRGSGWAVELAAPSCDTKQGLGSMTIRAQGSATFPPGHLALLANCSAGEIFEPQVRADELEPLTGAFGVPACFTPDPQTRLFDLDAQLQTSVYYLQLQAPAGGHGQPVPALMRRSNGVPSTLAVGVERLDFRYSLVDAANIAHWLDAAQVDSAKDGNGDALTCATSPGNGATRPCDWSDIDAVDISMLVNNVDELPPDSSAHAWEYRYSIDGDRMQSPRRVMPVTGLPAGHLQRREFHSVVALRDLAPQ